MFELLINIASRGLIFCPKNFLSRLVRVLTHLHFSKEFLQMLIYVYVWFFKIDMNQFQIPPKGFRNFSEFFSRPIKKEYRPFSSSKNTWISPCDNQISNFGSLKNKIFLEQIKGWNYSLEELLGGTEWNHILKDGYFFTLYLSPKDYHRMHAPMDGILQKIRYIPGNLWSVDPLSAKYVRGLFAKNERVVLEFQTDHGIFVMVFVGALNVGSIRLTHHPKLRTNFGKPKGYTKNSDVKVQKGDEVGLFEMGSTVILICPKTFQIEKKLQKNQKLLMGEKIGQWPSH